MAVALAVARRSAEPLLRLAVIAVIAGAIGLIGWLPFLLAAIGGSPADSGTAQHYLPADGALLSFPMLAVHSARRAVHGRHAVAGGPCPQFDARRGPRRSASLAVYAWSLLSMLTTLAGTTLLSFRLQPTLTVLLTAAGVFGFIEATLAVARRYSPETGQRIVVAAGAVGAIGAMTFAQDIPDVLRSDIAVAYTDTDGYGQRADRRPPGAEKYYREIDAKIQEVTGRPRSETVVLTADYSFLSYYPYYGFQGLTSHYANPLAQFDERAAAIERWADAGTPRPVHRRTRQAAVEGADGVPHASRRCWRFGRHLHAASGRRRLSQPAQRPSLPRRPRCGLVRRPPLQRLRHRAVRVGHPAARGRLMAVETPPQPGQLPSSPVVQDGARQTNHRTARLVAIIAGLLGAALALATPFLPVKQTTAQLNWPQNGVLQSVNAPLIGYVATDLDDQHPVLGGRRARRAAERGQDRAAVDGAQAGAEGRRSRPAHRTGQQRPARHRPQHPGGQSRR